MKHTYLAGLLLLGLGAGCTQDKYVLDAYPTIRYDVLRLPAPADTAKLLTVAFPAASVGFVGGQAGLLYATTDGGQTWLSRRQANLGDVHHLTFSSATAGWAATSNGLYRTSNGGQTWVLAQYASTNGFRYNVGATADVQFVTPLIGYAVGSGEIVKTMDGGANWFNQLALGHQRFSLRGVSFTSPDSGQVTGDTRYTTTNGGRTWAQFGSYFSYDILLYGKGRFLETKSDGAHFSDNPPFNAGGEAYYVDEDLHWPVYGLARLGQSMAAVGQNTVICRAPTASVVPGYTPWSNMHRPDGTSFAATFLAAAFADARTLYAVGEQGAIYRFYYPPN